MANMLKTGAVWLAGQLKDHASETVTYKRGVNSVSVQAVIAESLAETVIGDQVLVQIKLRDFIILAADLVLIGSPIVPEQNDQIIMTIGIETVTYSVFKMPGEKQYREWDRFGNSYRIHTKETSRV